MSKLPMKRVGIYGLKSRRKEILEALQRYGVLEPISCDLSGSGFEKLDTARATARFMNAKNILERALGVLNEYSPEKASLFSALEGKKTMTAGQYYELIENSDNALNIAREINELAKRIYELRLELVKTENSISALSPWKDLDIPLDFAGTKKTAAFIGTFPEEYTAEEITAGYFETLTQRGCADDNRYAIDVTVVHSDRQMTCAVIIGRRDMKNELDGILRERGFAAPVCRAGNLPRTEIERLRSKIAGIDAEIEENTARIVKRAESRRLIEFMADYYLMRIEKYELLCDINQRKKFFVIFGYVPEKYAAALEMFLAERYGAVTEISEVSEEDEVPVLLKNNKFSSPVETVLETYSMPNKTEIDPTFVLSLFYYFLFGLMLSDAGYGLLMILGCGFVLMRFRNMEPGMKKTIKMFFYCGISTFFWGILFGSFFGDAVAVIASTFFDSDLALRPLWFEPIKDPMRMLIFSFAIGIVHLFAGLGIKLYQLLREGDIKSAFFDVVCWYLLVGGGIAYLLTMDMFVSMANLSFKLPPAVQTAAVIAAAVGAAGITLFSGRSSRNIFKRIAKGLYDLYGVTGYLSDILSYSRLLALGLATGVIAQVFNQMGSMFGGGAVGAVCFTLIFVIGHSLNMAINLLGAYVHTNRLQFVEFFGKFYEGGGKKFEPFSANTNYFKFKEEK